MQVYMPNQYLEQEKEINNNNISRYIMHYLSKSQITSNKKRNAKCDLPVFARN